MLRILFIISCVFLLNFSSLLNAQTDKSQYKIVNKIHLEGDGGWDYLTVDDSTQRLFVSHATMVQIIDLKTGKLAGTISGLNGVHGITIANDLNKGFISNGRDSSVTIFNLKSLKTITNIKVTGSNPDAILYDKFSHLVFAFNGRSSNATVIDAKNNKVISTIKLDGKPEFSVSDGNGNVYVNIEDKSMVAVINSKTLKVEKQWPIAPGEEPSGLAIDNESHRLFMVCDNKLMVVVDALDGHLITTLPIGERVDGVAFDPVLKRVYSSNGDGTLTVVEEKSKDEFKVIEKIITQKGARTISLSHKTHHIYLPTAEFGETPKETKDNPRPRPGIKPGTFTILDVMYQK